MLGLPTAASINHLLKAAPWARQRLAPHAGKTIVTRFGPLPLRFTVDASGELRSASADAAPDVTIAIKPSLLVRTLTDGRSAFNDADVSGDTALAQTLAYIAQNLNWDYEEDLSKIVGDVAAYRIGTTARSVGNWAKHSSDSFMQMSKDFWTEERPTIAKSEDVAAFVVSVDELRDAAARLEKRIELLEKARRS
jgi:ubiquinone biosynthesis accessory factor UbiJ